MDRQNVDRLALDVLVLASTLAILGYYLVYLIDLFSGVLVVAAIVSTYLVWRRDHVEHALVLLVLWSLVVAADTTANFSTFFLAALVALAAYVVWHLNRGSSRRGGTHAE